MEAELLSDEARQELLNIARSSVISLLEGKKANVSTPYVALERERGAFVTLHRRGELRGCIGIFESNKPLFETVSEMAGSAAFNDPRFSPVEADEMDEIDFEISVLSPLREIKDVSEIEVGTHGIHITKGANRGVLLPQVATEQGWDLETFLAQTCLKAGLPADEWRRGVKIEIFSAEVFGEKRSSN